MQKTSGVQETIARFTPYAEYLEDLDILTVCLRDGAIARSCKGGTVWTNVDLDAGGKVVEVEFINVASLGVDLSRVPEWKRVERLILAAGLDLAIRAPSHHRRAQRWP